MCFDSASNARRGAMHQQCAEVPVAALADASQSLLRPVEFSRGISPSQAARSRPLSKAWPSLIAATNAVAVCAATPGISRYRPQASLDFASVTSWRLTASILLSSPSHSASISASRTRISYGSALSASSRMSASRAANLDLPSALRCRVPAGTRGLS